MIRLAVGVAVREATEGGEDSWRYRRPGSELSFVVLIRAARSWRRAATAR